MLNTLTYWLCVLTTALTVPVCGFGGAAAVAGDASTLASLKVPPGFRIEVLAQIPQARGMALGKDYLFVGTSSRGEVYALPLYGNGNNSNRQTAPLSAGKAVLLASNLPLPGSLAFDRGALYVGALDRILRFDQVEDVLRQGKLPAARVLSDQLPDTRWHGIRTMGIGPDQRLYVAVGAPCNVCEEPEPWSRIMRMNLDGSGVETFAAGVRNSVGFDWQPQSGVLWFSDNGRDMLGDDIPACEINRAPRAGMHFGFPYCHAGDIVDPEFPGDCAKYVAPAWKLGAHVAPLGIHFYRGQQFPAEYQNQLMVAEHGSWNRSKKVGYRVVMLKIVGDKVVSEQNLVSGWLQGESYSGRPVGVITAPDGSLLISDDYAGVIYRLSYGNSK